MSDIITKNQKKTLMEKNIHKILVQRTFGNGMLPNTEEL